MIYTSAVVFVPYLDVEKRFLQHSIMAQSCMFDSTTMGQQDYFCSKTLWPALRRIFCVVFKLFTSFDAKFTTATILLITHHLVPRKKLHLSKIVYLGQTQ